MASGNSATHLVPAEGELLDEIVDLTYPLWGEGLSRSAYATWNRAQQQTAWGRRQLQRLALIDRDRRLLSTAKRYQFDARLDDRHVRVCGIGAVYTPPDRRGQRQATAIVQRLLNDARTDGAEFAALFTQIGTPFYERLGFRAVELDEVTVQVTRKGGSPAMLVRAGDERDLPALAAMHDVRSAGARFALRRDVPLIQYALARKRLLAGLAPAGRRQLEFFVAEEGASAVAYVVLSVNEHGWTLEEAGDRDPAGARLGAMLQVLLAREPTHEAPLIRAWWPRAFAVPPQLELTGRTAPRDVLMMAALGPSAVPAAAETFYWRSDEF